MMQFNVIIVKFVFRNVLCGNPVNPPDWEISYSPFMYTGTTFNVTLTIAPNVPLPTRPKLRIVSIQGDQRLDHDLEVLNGTALTFYINDVVDIGDVPDCDNGDSKCITELEMEDVGVETNLDSGTSS